MYEQLKLENQLCFRLYTASRLVTQAYTPFLEPLGITYPQYLVLLVLWEKDNQLVGDIAHKLVLESNTITPLLQRMEREELVIRTKGIADGRQTLVSLTKKGRRLEEQAKTIPSCITQCWDSSKLDIDKMINMTRVIDELIALLKEEKGQSTTDNTEPRKR